MAERYIPQIREAAIPEDGAWVDGESGPILLLSIPDWKEEGIDSADVTAYVWMYDREHDAYLFCFRLMNEQEKAVAFPKEHAGLLLLDENSKGVFSIMVSHQSLQSATSEDLVLFVENLNLIRHPSAGW